VHVAAVCLITIAITLIIPVIILIKKIKLVNNIAITPAIEEYVVNCNLFGTYLNPQWGEVSSVLLISPWYLIEHLI